MKKIVLLIGLMMVTTLSIIAQDTLRMYNPKSTYYNNGWPDSSQRYARNQIETARTADMWANGFYTEDSLVIYGIATALFTDRADIVACEDPDPTHAIEYLMLFEYDSVEWLRPVAEPLPVCEATTRPAYYWDFEDGSGLAVPDMYTEDPFPVYECYFSEPYTIIDSFYVGMTSNFWFPEKNYTVNGQWRYTYATIPYYNFVLRTGLTPAPYKTFEHRHSSGRWTSWWTHYVFIMPIIAIDSSIYPGNGSEENAIGEGAMANRFVVISPNPTKGEVKVTSSVGMTLVEVYNTAGVKVAEKQVAINDLQTRLDIGDLPHGSYIVRVHTSVGLAVKKLVVQ